jgi:hypothetical protein
MKEQIVACVNAWWGDLCEIDSDDIINDTPDDFNEKLEAVLPDMKFSYIPQSNEWILL